MCSEKKKDPSSVSSEKFIRSFDINPLPQFIVRKKDLHIIEANKKLISIIGYKKKEIIGHSPVELGMIVDSEKVERFGEIVNEGSLVEDWEFDLKTKQGKIRHVLLYSENININNKDCILFVMVDITERKKMEEDLRLSEEKYEALVESSPESIFMVDESGDFISINKKAAKALGAKPKDIINKNMYDLFPKEIASKQLNSIKKMFQTKEPVFEADSVTRTVSGNRWHNTLLAPVKDQSDRIKYILGISRDITERKKLEEELKKSKEEYKLIIENQTDLIIKVDTEGTILYTSPSYCKAFGKTEEELRGKKFMPMVHPDDIGDTLATMKNLYRPPHYVYVEQRAMTVDGWRWFSWIDTAILDENKNVIEILGVGRDITARMKAEKKLKKSEEKFRTLVESMNEGLSIKDEKGIRTYVNDRYCKITGYTKEELIGKKPLLLMDEENKRIAYEQYKKREKGHSGAYEINLTHKNGKKIPVIVSPSPMNDEKGNFNGSFGVITDITEQKMMERSLIEINEKYSSLLSNIEGVVYQADENIKIGFLSEKILDITGYPASDFLSGKRVPTDIFHPDDLNRAKKFLSENIKKMPNAFEFEYRIICKDGSVKWIHDKMKSIYGEDGRYRGVNGVYFDITDRKNIENALKESEEKYRRIFESNIFLVYLTDIKGNILLANKKGAAFMGKTQKTIIGRSFFELRPDRKEMYQNVIDMIVKNNKTMQFETLFPTPKEDKWLFVTVSPLKINNEKRLQIITEDITDRKNAQEALKESEERWRSLTKNSPDNIITLDADLKIEYMNYFPTDLKKEDLIGKPIYAFISDKKEVLENKKLLEQVLNTGKTITYETQREMPDGKIIYFETRAVRRIIDNKVLGLTLHARIMNDRKEAEEKNVFLAEILNNSPLPVIASDIIGNIIYINTATEELFGYKKDELIGKSPGILNAEVNAEEIQNDIMDKIRSGKVWRGEVLNKKKSGDLFPVYLTVSRLLDESGNIIALVGFQIDITKQNKTESEKEKLLEGLKEKNKDLEQIISVISHDLRSPMLNIRGFNSEVNDSLCEIYGILQKEREIKKIKEKIISIIDETTVSDLNYIRNSLDKVDSLLSSLLHISRHGRIDLKMVDIEMNDLITEVLGSIEYKIKKKKVKIKVDKLPSCRGDRAQLNQVFSNLINNAINYLSPKRPGEIVISGRKNRDQIEYCCEDNGIGIKKEDQDRIFQLFQRINPKKSDGEGMGLTIVKRIVSRHNGNIWVESIYGKGSKFCISLPID